MQQLWEPALRVPSPVAAIAEPRWYAIHTRARHEKKVTTQLQDRGVTTFLPLIAHRHRWSDRNKTIQLALFPCYTSVRIEACHAVILSAAERSEESRSGLFRRQKAGRDASPAGRDQHDSERALSRTS